MMNQETKILDGGFSTQLSTHVGEKIDGDPLWTGRFLATDPDAVFQTHLDFLRAGSDIIETNTYQASVTGYKKYLNLTEDESLNLITLAANLAQKAVSLYKKETKDIEVTNPKPLIAGSCGPYGAALHDGSEYTGSYGKTVSIETMMDWHRPRMETLVKAGVDLLALETIPCAREAEALVELLREFPGMKAWLAFSCAEDGKSLADGKSFTDAAVRCYRKAQPGQLLAVGVNCLSPRLVTSLLKDINRDKKNFVPLVAYPNSGEKYTVMEGWKIKEDFHPPDVSVQEWLDLGVKYVGGCCRTDARDVIKIQSEVQFWKVKRGVNGQRNCCS